MLILTRKLGERFFIGDDIEVVILDVTGNQVKVGIVAPKEVEVFREEVYRKVQDERQAIPQRKMLKRNFP